MAALKVRELLRRFWVFFSGLGVQIKIMGIVLGLVLLFGLGVTLQVRAALTRSSIHELEIRGVSIARDMSARSTDLILTNNIFALYELLRDTVENNEDVRYAFILDPGGDVLVHSFGSGFPQGLVEANSVRSDERFRLEVLDTEEGLIRDVAVPIFGGRAGTARLGMSEHRLREVVAATTRQLLLTTALVSLIGVAAAYLLTRVFTTPILALVEATQAVARGDFNTRAPRWFPDEIGKLSAAFNAMTEDLARSHREREEFNRELLRRNRELSALNTVATAMSGLLEPEEALERALGQVLEALELQAGWIFLLRGDGQRPILASWIGLPAEIGQREVTAGFPDCPCRKVLQDRRPLIVNPLPVECPVRGADLGDGKQVICHATVPLMAKSQILGVLSVVGHEASQFSAEDLQLLEAVGHQMGVAIENARLWEELKRKEELRRRLLEKVITAQEEERQRIARELHDETSQALTSLMVGLKVLEGASTLEEVREGTAELRAIAAQTLKEVHELALELRPSVLDDLGLVAALQRYAKGCTAKFGLDVDLQTIGLGEKRLPPEVETTLYRIVQEALTNAAKHAQARNVSVLLERRGESVVAIVEDDGQGFDVQQVLASRDMAKKLGLYGIQERASLIGGKLTIESEPGMGTTVFVEIPLEKVSGWEEP